jgi:SAM-dependent methyltransferase
MFGRTKVKEERPQKSTLNLTLDFTAHNILLDDGTQTKPDMGLMSQHPWCQAAKNLLRVLYPNGLEGVKIVDLGCLEGGYTVEFARLGMDALGLEVRDANFTKCCYVRDHLSLPNLRFEKDDAWNLTKYGPYDVIFCCGLLYHLDRPREFIKLMESCCNRVLIINTHFAPDEPTDAHLLSDMEENEGLAGRWYGEHDGTPEQKESALWSSWDNYRSFWLRRPDLIHAIKNAGFQLVFEQFDPLGEDIRQAMADGEYGSWLRSTFVGIK